MKGIAEELFEGCPDGTVRKNGKCVKIGPEKGEFRKKKEELKPYPSNWKKQKKMVERNKKLDPNSAVRDMEY